MCRPQSTERGRSVALVVLPAVVTKERHLPPLPRGLRRAIFPLVLLGFWQLSSSVHWLNPRVLPSPWAIVQTFQSLSDSGQLQSALAASLVRVAEGGAIGISIGLVLGTVAGLWRIGEEVVDAVLQMLRTLPFLALVPLFIIWFGIGQTPKLTLIALGTAFPIYLNTFSGIRNVDARLIEMAQTFGVRGWRLAVQVTILGALPQILVGLRYSLGIAWLSLIVAEQINASNGLGLLLLNAQNFFETNVLLVVLVCYGFFGLSSDLIVRFLERRLLSWRVGFTGT
jgi:sulfonate transport system permease protein